MSQEYEFEVYGNGMRSAFTSDPDRERALEKARRYVEAFRQDCDDVEVYEVTRTRVEMT